MNFGKSRSPTCLVSILWFWRCCRACGGSCATGHLWRCQKRPSCCFGWQAWHFMTFWRVCTSVKNSFCVGAVLLQGCQKMTIRFRARGSRQRFGRVHVHFAWQDQHFRRVALCILANRIGRAASSRENVQLPWQAWDMDRLSCCLAGASHFALGTSHSTTLSTPHLTPQDYTLHSALCTLHFTLHALHFALRTVHFSFSTFTLYSYTLHSALCTLHSHFTLYTSHLKLETSLVCEDPRFWHCNASRYYVGGPRNSRC